MVEQIGKARGAAYALRLEDVEHGGALSAVCLLCRHEAALDVEQLLDRWTRHARLVMIEERLRCKSCGAAGDTGACKLRVTWSPS